MAPSPTTGNAFVLFVVTICPIRIANFLSRWCNIAQQLVPDERIVNGDLKKLLHGSLLKSPPGRLRESWEDLRETVCETKDHIEGKGKQIKGAIKDKAGELVNDRDLDAEGNAERREGKVQELVGEVRRNDGDALEKAGKSISGR